MAAGCQCLTASARGRPTLGFEAKVCTLKPYNVQTKASRSQNLTSPILKPRPQTNPNPKAQTLEPHVLNSCKLTLKFQKPSRPRTEALAATGQSERKLLSLEAAPSGGTWTKQMGLVWCCCLTGWCRVAPRVSMGCYYRGLGSICCVSRTRE